jgi:exodeoxyribonuclease V beta subunit
VIEASAGTGKTYTIEQRVLELLLSGKAKLKEILVVTFTEKATGDLKSRLRQRLESALAEYPDRHDVLQAALDGFHHAQIYTIHAFCQRALTDFAFENRQELQSRLVDDREVLRLCLREIQRKTWREQYGERLQKVLEIADYPGSSEENWRELVLDLAINFRPGCGHRLLPEPVEGWLDHLGRLETQIRDHASVIRQLAGESASEDVQKHRWYLAFSQLDLYERHLRSRLENVLTPTLRWLADDGTDDNPIASFQTLLTRCFERESKSGFRLLTSKTNKRAFARLEESHPDFVQACELLEELRSKVEWRSLGTQLLVSTVHLLRDAVRTYKHERGLQSYEDMLVRMDEGLDLSKNRRAATLLQGLRHRYRFAIVDEFQDTDAIQWRIFKRIFIEGDPAQRLIVVGDPKQAIFGWRGADVHTYNAATSEMRGQHGAQVHELDVNWRSCPEMIQSLNKLFLQGRFFADTDVAYHPVKSPIELHPPKELRNRIVNDRTDRAAVTITHFGEPERLAKARARNAYFIADEIHRLLGEQGLPALEIAGKDEPPRPLRADDICILLLRHREAWPLLRALRWRHIAYSLYKQQGLWQSDEAQQLRHVLRALAKPGDPRAFRQALLTRFFRIRPAALSLCLDPPENHPARTLFRSWLELAESGRWGQLFRSFLEDTGLMFDEPQAADFERRMANYRHLTHALQQAAYGQKLDVVGLLELLDERHRQPAEDADVQPIETERPKVKIMTVHASKGLEFPVVFLAGGWTSGKTPRYRTYRDDNGLVFDLGPEAQAVDEERAAEDRRLLYVALTRAMFKLYVPTVALGKKYPKEGPLVSMLAPAIVNAALPSHQVDEFVSGPGSEAARPVPLPLDKANSPATLVTLTKQDLFPRIPSDLRERRIRTLSFSSIHRAELASFAERPSRVDPAEQDDQKEHEPLRGAVFGNLVHDVLEKIDYAAVGEAKAASELLRSSFPTRKLFDDEMKTAVPKLSGRGPVAPLEERCRNILAELVWNGMHTPLAVAGGPLWTIPKRDRLQELEFLNAGQGPGGRAAKQETFYTGYMDLVFRRGDDYFLVDWKTNVLSGGYGGEALDASMTECGYKRQFEIYLEALGRWLARMRGGRPARIRGVYYLYLRGMNGRDDNAGVYFHEPTLDDSPVTPTAILQSPAAP